MKLSFTLALAFVASQVGAVILDKKRGSIGGPRDPNDPRRNGPRDCKESYQLQTDFAICLGPRPDKIYTFENQLALEHSEYFTFKPDNRQALTVNSGETVRVCWYQLPGYNVSRNPEPESDDHVVVDELNVIDGNWTCDVYSAGVLPNAAGEST